MHPNFKKDTPSFDCSPTGIFCVLRVVGCVHLQLDIAAVLFARLIIELVMAFMHRLTVNSI